MTNNEIKIYLKERRQECWVNDVGEYHREDGPAIINYYKNGKIADEKWLINGKYHRIDGPAITRYTNGNAYREIWYIDGINYRIEGPAFIEYYANSNIKQERWTINGKNHREDGPSIIRYDRNGKIIDKTYYYNDHDITDIIEKLFRRIPDKLTKDQVVLLKLSLPEEYFKYDI